MNENTKRSLDYIIKLSTIRNFKSSFVISKIDNKFVGVDIRFDPPLDLDDFPSIKEVMKARGDL